MLLTDTLYWTVSIEMIHFKDQNTNFLRLIAFVYVPTILMVFNYVLLYHVHEK